MDLRDFQYLIALAEEGSVSKAADRLFMAQSSLSQFLQQYESELGVKLFIRTSRGIRPTSNGEVFIGHLRQMLSYYDQARRELWDNEGLKGGSVTLGISTFRGRHILPRILKRFYELYPDVRVEVVEHHSLKLEELLLEGKLDVAVVVLPAAKLKNEAVPFTKDEVLLVAPKGHPLTQKAKPCSGGTGHWVSLRDAAKYSFVLSYHDTILGNISRNLFQQHKIKYKASNENISASMAVAMAKNGLGLAFTYASSVEWDEQIEMFRIGETGVFIDLGVALPSQEYHSRAAKAMEDVIREVYRQECSACVPNDPAEPGLSQCK